MTTVAEFLASKGVLRSFTLDGSMQRFIWRSVSNPDGWFIGREVELGGKRVTRAILGSWKTGEEWHYEESSAPLDSQELAELERLQAEMSGERAREKLARQEEAREKAVQRWARCLSRGSSPYLERKGVGGLGLLGTRLMQLSDGSVLTVVPIRTLQGELWGLQYVHGDGKKTFGSGTRVEGGSHWISDDKLTEEFQGDIYVCEGLATGASIFAYKKEEGSASRFGVLCAFTAGNLSAVCLALRHFLPSVTIHVCADNDSGTRTPVANPGLVHGREAARVCGGLLHLPVFDYTRGGKHGGDFNDLHVEAGLPAVGRSLDLALDISGRRRAARPGREDDVPLARVQAMDQAAGLRPLTWGVTKTGAPRPPTDQQVAEALLSYYGDRLVTDEGDLFIYERTHWVPVPVGEEALLLRQIQLLYSGRATHSKLMGILELVKAFATIAPVKMYEPRHTCANFLNGTLHAVRQADYTYHLEFRPHNKQDYLLTTIPLDYDPERKAHNAEFEDMLVRIFGEDAKGKDKIRAVAQMYGSCLMPLYPHLFLLHGPQGSGKTSVIMPAQRLIHQDNWCSVEPHEFKGFLMETMVGKIANIVTDINTSRPMDDANLKKVEDSIPMRIDRKFKGAVHAPLPATHIFGANNIPPTLDASSGAHSRRWTFISVDRHKTEPGKYRKNFANWVFDQNPQGVLNFALRGLEDLIAMGGHFEVTESGAREMVNWQKSNEVVASFLDAIRGNEVDTNTRLFMSETAKMRRALLFKNFKMWCEESGWSGRGAPMTNQKFYGALRQKGFEECILDGYTLVKGIGVREGEEAKC